MSIPNRAGILTPIDGLEDGEEITMLIMPVSCVIRLNTTH
jgi:DNA polymerase-3 subunit beta